MKLRSLLALDPGSTYTGFCIRELDWEIKPPFSPDGLGLQWGTLKALPDVSMAVTVSHFIDTLRPPDVRPPIDIIACEKSFPPKSSAVYAKNWEKTAEVRGVIKSFVRPGVQFFELTAQEVRSALKIPRLAPRHYNIKKIKGLGGLTQDARVKKVLCDYTGIAPEDFKTSHEVDAVALAYVVCSRLGIAWR